MSDMEQKRETYYDFLRGCAILFVVAIHTFGLSFANGSFPLPSICFRNFLNIAVPIFLALSGFFMARKQVERNNFAPFFKKQFFRVYLPVLFCSIPLLLENVLGGGSVTKNTLYLMFCGYSIYYFVAVIIQCYLLLPFLNYAYNKGWKAYFLVIICSLMLAVCGWAVKSYILPKYGISLPLIAYAGGFWMWSVFFIFGYYLGRQKERAYSIKPWILLSFLFFILCVFESLFLDKLGCGIGVGQKPSAMFFSICMIPLLLSEKIKGSFDKFNWKLKDLFCSIGFYSFGIYLIHCYVLLLYRTAVKKTLHFPASGYWHWACLTIVVLMISYGFLWGMKKFFPQLTRVCLGV
jgi:surface polysaccharide O-acyltransferase-like enzyme